MIYDPFDDPTLEVWPEGGAAIVRKRQSVATGLRLPTLRLVTLPPVNVAGEESRSEKPEAPGRHALAAAPDAAAPEDAAPVPPILPPLPPPNHSR